VDLFNKTYYRNLLKTPTIPSNLRRRNTTKEKNSKFFGSAYPIQSEDEVKLIIDGLRKKHPHAGHFVMPIK
jgi:putative IMPACT (imprinted ancient) family translation regulator